MASSRRGRRGGRGWLRERNFACRKELIAHLRKLAHFSVFGSRHQRAIADYQLQDTPGSLKRETLFKRYLSFRSGLRLVWNRSLSCPSPRSRERTPFGPRERFLVRAARVQGFTYHFFHHVDHEEALQLFRMERGALS